MKSSTVGAVGLPNFMRADPFPSTRICQLKYSDIFVNNTNATAALYGNQIDLKLNSIFAPVAGGHQPYGRDSLALIYQRYSVFKVVVDLKFSTNVVNPVLFTAALSLPGFLEAMTGNGFSVIADQPNARTELCGGVGAPAVKMHFEFDLARLLGMSREQYIADTADYGSVMTASPAQSFFLSIAAVGPIVGALAFTCEYEINYHTKLYDRVLQPQS
jgi:hypothetical protein